jgi:large subunit ribosomal protein LP1
LQLSASFGTALQPGEPASMQGLLLTYNRQLHDQQRTRASSGPSPTTSSNPRYSVRPLGHGASSRMSRSGSIDLTLSDFGEPRIRPRTGTGMVYRKSSMSLTRAAADVQAQSRIRMVPERTGPVVS